MSLGIDRIQRNSERLLHRHEPLSFSILAEGCVTRSSPQTSSAVASGPRCVLMHDREVICTYMVQSTLGSNDFVPMLARSSDDGLTWQEQGPLFPQFRYKFSLFGSISASPRGELFFYGTRTAIEAPGETFWCKATHGIKVNELFWTRSLDHGRTWPHPVPIPMPIPGSAEAPGAMCIAKDGTWHACYAPYNTFDPMVIVPRNQVVLMSSRDGGSFWYHTAMMRFSDAWATAAEAWVAELADGRLLGTCWNINQRDGSDYPNPYALSNDGGRTWSLTRSTGILGQSTALSPLRDGSALFICSRRKHGKVGIWLANVLPTADDFGVLSNEIVWEAPHPTSANSHSEWTNFSFGEPSATLLGDDTILIVFWCIHASVGSIQYVKLKSSKIHTRECKC